MQNSQMSCHDITKFQRDCIKATDLLGCLRVLGAGAILPRHGKGAWFDPLCVGVDPLIPADLTQVWTQPLSTSWVNMQQAQVTDPHSLSQGCKEQRPDLRTPDAALLCKGVTQICWQVAHHV